ncbi:MAG: glycoside hydrolase family 3 protein [Clostridia bacterium]|nr:glycoside hydrolase family 3 protein [Clostridia bacterium]
MDNGLKLKIGQMIMAGFPSPQVDEQAKKLVNDYLVGNFVLFKRNFVSYRQTGRMCEELSRLAFEKTGIAPIISTDQEGGSTNRMSEGASLLPGAMAVAAADADGEFLGETCARILKSVGVNTDLAPVMDVNSNPMNPIIGTRSYGDTPEKVKKYGLAELRGMQKGGLIATMKHFPGHGNVSSDSHLTLPSNSAPKQELYSVDFEPFRAGAQAVADALMSCHVVFPSMDPDNPATVSRRIMTGLLREEMGFKGIAMTDCIEMNAICVTYGYGEGAVKAIEAGCDLLCISHTYEAVSAAAEAIYAAVESGRISEERINESYERLLRIKQRYGLTKPFVFDEKAADELIHDRELIRRVRSVNYDAVTLISGDGKVRLDNTVFLSPYAQAMTRYDNPDGEPDSFAKQAAKALGGEEISFPIEGVNEEAEKRIMASDAGYYVLGLYNARFCPGQLDALKLIKQKGRPCAVVIFGAPYDNTLIEGADTVLVAYEYSASSVDAVIEALKNREYKGRLPVEI